MRKIEVNPMPYQEAALLDFDTPIVGVAGGKRSGKSRLITCAKSIIASSIHRGKPIIVASPTYGMTRRNLLPIYRELAEQWGIRIEGLQVKSPSELTIQWGNQTSTLVLDVTIENYERLNGMSLAGAFVDEIDKARHDDAMGFLEEVIFRCSNPGPGLSPCINITGAPELNGALGEFFVENATPEKKLYKWSMLDNYMLSQEYKDRILSTIPANKQKAWVLGELIYNSDGLVYDCYDPTANYTALELKDVLPHETIHVMWDINDGGTSCYLGVRRGDDLFLIDEWVKMKDTKSVLDKVAQQPWANRALLTCDPACTQVFAFIQASRLRHSIMKSAPEITHRVTAVNLRLKNALGVPHLFINPKKCPVLAKCITRQGYVNGEPDKKTFIEQAGTDISGPLDAIGYWVYREFPFNPRTNAPISIRGF